MPKDFSDCKLITTGNIDHLQRTNKLKGTAAEKLFKSISKTFDNNGEATITKILKKLDKESRDRYIIKKSFKLSISTYDTPFKTKFSYKNIYFNQKFLEKNNVVAIEHKKRGLKDLAKGAFWVQHFENTDTKNQDIIQYLISENIIALPEFMKRVDSYIYNNGSLVIFESKNKELTSITERDYYMTLYYATLLTSQNIPTRKIVILYNGPSRDSISKVEKRINESGRFPFLVQFTHLIDFCKINEVYPKIILVEKTTKGYEYKISTDPNYDDDVYIYIKLNN